MFCFATLTASLLLALAHITRLDTVRNDTHKRILSLATIGEASGALSDMEAGNRGFLLTGDAKFRETFHQGRDIFSSRYQQLLADTANEPIQQERLRSIKAKLTQWFNLYRPLIQKRQREVEGSPSPRSQGITSTANGSPRDSLERNFPISSSVGRQPSGREFPEMSYGEQSALVLCHKLFIDIRFALDEIRTYEEKQLYGMVNPTGRINSVEDGAPKNRRNSAGRLGNTGGWWRVLSRPINVTPNSVGRNIDGVAVTRSIC
jgi:hypothetical protein